MNLQAIETERLVQKVQLSAADVRTCRKAFAGMERCLGGQTEHQLQIKEGVATLSDGYRLHSIPVNHHGHTAVSFHFDEVRQIWDSDLSATLTPTSVRTFLSPQDLIPKPDVGILCDVELWLPFLDQVLNWGHCMLTLEDESTVVQPIDSVSESLSISLPHKMYKGKQIKPPVQRGINLPFIYDVFKSASELGDSRVFFCVVSTNEVAPVLCRGNYSNLLALLLPLRS